MFQDGQAKGVKTSNNYIVYNLH